MSTMPPTSELLPWTWGGWAGALEKRGRLERREGLLWAGSQTLLLTREALEAAPKETLQKALAEAGRVFVDFFPDEIALPLWNPLRGHVARIFFLPPWVALPTLLGQTRSKWLLLSESEVEKLGVPALVERPQDATQVLYKPLEVDQRHFSKIFDFKRVDSARAVAESLNAPGWVLLSPTPQVEHALFVEAAQHGVRVDFWDRRYSSPLRVLAGHEKPFDACREQTLRERIRRLRAVQSPPEKVERARTLEEVEARFGFDALGFAENPGDLARVMPRELLEAPLPKVIADQMAVASLRTTLSTTVRRTHEGSSLHIRAWEILVFDALTRYAPVAQQSLSHLWQRDAALTAKALRDLLECNFQNGVESTREVLPCVLEALLYFKTEGVAPLVEFVEERKAAWEVKWDSRDNYLYTRTLLEILKGNLGMPAEIKKKLGAEAFRGVALLREGKASEGAKAVLKELERQSGVVRDLVLRELLLQQSPALSEALDKTAKVAGDAECYLPGVMATTEGFLADAAWCAQRKKGLEALTAKIFGKKPTQNVALRWTFAPLAGRAQAAVKEFRDERAKHGEAMGLFLAHCLWRGGETRPADELLQELKGETFKGLPLALYAALSFLAGRPKEANAALGRLRAFSEAFWLPPVCATYPGVKELYAGMLGAAVGDAEIAGRALRHLEGPAWEDKRAQIKAARQVLPQEELERTHREWILKWM